MRFQETTFRPLFGRVLAVVIGVLGLVALGSTVLEGRLDFALRTLGPVALVVVLTFAAFWSPRVAVREQQIEVRNVFSTAFVPWGAIRRIDTKWSLTLVTDRGTVSAWASPAPGRYATLGMSRSDVDEVTLSARAAADSIRPGDALNTDSGAVAHVIRSHWEQLRDDDLLDPPNAGTGPRRVPHVVTIAVVGVAAVATALSFLL